MATHQPHIVGRSFELLASLFLLCSVPGAEALHHMNFTPDTNTTLRFDTVPLRVTNQCSEDIYPGIYTEPTYGNGPSTQGFKLSPGDRKDLNVGGNWQGRVWGRTNCTFNAEGTGPSANGGFNGGKSCQTGDCKGLLDCDEITVRCDSKYESTR